MLPKLILIRGAGDLASGVAHRLNNSGFQVIMLELPEPLVVRTTVSYASAVYEGKIEVEDVEAVLCRDNAEVDSVLANAKVAILIDPGGMAIRKYEPQVIIDATMIKHNRLSMLNDAELVIGLGPGFAAGVDVKAVIETKRGHELGRVIYSGSAIADTGEPGKIEGFGRERLLRAPIKGIFKPDKKIGDLVEKGDNVASVGDCEVLAEIDGMVRGMLYAGLMVEKGTKIGDIDPRGDSVDYKTISDKARAIGGGVLEAILHHFNR